MQTFVNTLSNSHNLKIKKYIKEAFNREVSDAEIEEIKLSLYYFAKAKIEYLRQKKGGIIGNI